MSHNTSPAARVVSRFLSRKASSWDGKIVGKEFRLSWSHMYWKLEELPAKGKKKLRIATMGTDLDFTYLGNVDAFIPENIIQDVGGISPNDSYDRVKEKILRGKEQAGKKIYDAAADKTRIDWLLKPHWSEEQVHFLKVVPENVEPFTVEAKDFTLRVSWTEFSAYSPSSDLQASDPYYSQIASTAPAHARKLYQFLKTEPNALKSVSFDKFDEWLKSKKINYKYNHSVWH